MKILFLTNVPSPYRVRFFNELARYCDLTVVYEKERSDERNEKWVEDSHNSYRSVFLKGVRTAVDGAFAPGILKYLKKDLFDLTIICGISSPTQMLAICWCQMRRIPYAIEGDGAFSKDGKDLRETVKRLLIQKASLCFSTCRMHDAYYRRCGAAEHALVRYPFTSVDAADVADAPASREEKAALRRDLGIREETVFLAVGQFIHRKGFDVLMKAAAQLPKNAGIYILGGEPGEEYLELQDKLGLSQVHFAGFMPKTELFRYFRAADAFVLPTREDIWGLVVNEAMAHGLPVITTTRCNAGLELIEDGVNGFLVEPEDVRALARAMEKTLAADFDVMGRAALDTIRGYTIEEMARRHHEIFTEYLEEHKH